MSKKMSSKPNMHKQRGMNYRFNRNQDALQQDHDRMAEKYNFKALEQWDGLEKLKHYDMEPAAILPMSTRGIGLILAKHWDMIMSVFPNLFQNFNDVAIYRYSLLQLEGRRRRIQEHVAIVHPEFNTNLLNSQHIYEAIYTNGKNFGMIAEAINSYGIIDHAAGKFIPCVPSPRYLTCVATDDGMSRKRRCLHPNPHYVTICNLRETVEALTQQYHDLVTPEMRMHFRKFNPIPGLEWNADGFLINPDSIIPAQYTLAHMESDIAAASNFFNRAKVGNRIVLGDVNYDTPGDVSALCSSSLMEDYQGDWRVKSIEEIPSQGILPIEPYNVYVGSPYKTIDATVLSRSLAYLMGEITPEGSRDVEIPDMLHVRNRFSLTSLCILPRRVVVDAYGKC